MSNYNNIKIDANDIKKLFVDSTLPSSNAIRDEQKIVILKDNASQLPTNFIPHIKQNPQNPYNQEKYVSSLPENLEISKKNIVKSILFWTLLIVIAFIVGFLIVNGPAVYKKIAYLFSSPKDAKIILDPQIKVSPNTTNTNLQSLPDNRLIIPKINVDAPIIWNTDESQVQNKMTEGVVHYKNTSLPNQKGGNIFITGHSSNYWWIKSNYNQVFALLDNLEAGDTIVITYQKNKYVYKIYDKFTVSPKEVEVMNIVEGKSTLTLMSCVPIGTNFKRLIVRAELLYSDEPVLQSTNPSFIESMPKSISFYRQLQYPIIIYHQKKLEFISTPKPDFDKKDYSLPTVN